MYATTDVEQSRQRREEVARQVGNNRLTRRLRAARQDSNANAGNALLGRVFAWPSRNGHAANC